jgi:hypothetical protein
MNPGFFPTALNAIKFRGKENENLLTPFVIFQMNVAIRRLENSPLSPEFS